MNRQYMAIAELEEYPDNPRIHPPEQIANLAADLQEFGQQKPVVIWRDPSKKINYIIAGNGVTKAAASLGWPDIWVEVVPASWHEAKAVAFLLADNMGGATDDTAQYARLLAMGIEAGISLAAMGSNEAELSALAAQGLTALENLTSGQASAPQSLINEEARRTLAEQFGAPPFTVLDARQGYWQARKRAWLDLGVRSLHIGQEATRGATGGAPMPAMKSKSVKYTDGFKRGAGDGSLLEENKSAASSIDPVLCELVYNWFSPRGFSSLCASWPTVLDPFCGSSTSALVASYLSQVFTGIDLRAAQVETNVNQWREFSSLLADRLNLVTPDFVTGDAANMAALLPGREYDLIFTNPPYYKLEVYSDMPEDLSAAPDYAVFLAMYRTIINLSAARLKPNRFAVFLVSNIRDDCGVYYNLVSDTVAACQEAGLLFYNDAVLVNVAGTLPIRVGGQFQNYRKLGKSHQNVLVFYKGDTNKIKEFGPVEVKDFDPTISNA